MLVDEPAEDDARHNCSENESGLAPIASFELELLLQSAGWEVDELYGNYELEAYGPSSDRLLVVAR